MVQSGLESESEDECMCDSMRLRERLLLGPGRLMLIDTWSRLGDDGTDTQLRLRGHTERLGSCRSKGTELVEVLSCSTSSSDSKVIT